LRKMKDKNETKEISQIYEAFFDNAKDGILIADIENKYFHMSNKMIRQMLGYSPEEIKHIGVMNIHPDETLPYVIEQFDKLLKKELGIAINIPVKRKDGSIIYADINSFVVTLSGKTYLAGIFRDVTDRKRVEVEIRAFKKQMEFILGVTKTGLDIIDSDFNIRYVDLEWQKIYGDPTGRKCYEYFMGRSEMCPSCGIPIALEKKTAIVTEEVLVKEGNRPIQVTTIPFQNTEGEWLVAEVNVDITKLKHTENELKEREKQLEFKTKNLEEINTALSVLLKKREEDKTVLEEKVLSNIKQLVEPYISKLKQSGLDEGQKALAVIIESNLKDITSSFAYSLSSRHLNLTPSEVKIANLIKQDMTSKEICEILGSSQKVVAFHRQNIRRKLGLQNKKVNLKSYLMAKT
jgi:PAS domain S-box-containing protein